MPEVLGIAFIDIVARASNLSKQAQVQIRTALAGAESTAANVAGGSIAKDAERQVASGISTGAHRGVRDLERETQGVFRRIHGQTAGFIQSALGIGGKGLAIAAIGASVGLLAKGAVDYQEQTAKLANSAQITQAQADKIGEAFLHTAGKSTFSGKAMITAFAPIAGVFRTIYGQALTAAQSVQFMATAQHLAEASGTPLASVTKNLAQILITYHLGLGQASHASDVLYNTSRNLGVPLQDIQSQFQRLAPRLAGTGTTIGQTAGLFQELAKQVGTGRFALRTAGIAVQNLVEPSGNAKKALASLGISLTDAHGKFIGINPAIEKIHNAVLKLPAGVAGAAAAQKLQAISINETRLAQEKLVLSAEKLAISQHKSTSAAQSAALTQRKQAIDNQIAALRLSAPGKAVSDQIEGLKRSKLAITEQQQALRGSTGSVSQQTQVINTHLAAIALQERAYKLQEPALKAQAGALNKNGLLTALFGRQANIMSGIIAGGVPALNKAIKATNEHGTAQKAAERVAGTLAGRLKTLRATASDMAIELGQKLAPAVSVLITAFTGILTAVQAVIGFIGDHSTVFEIAGAAVGVFALAIGGATAATALYTAVTSGATAIAAGFRGAMLLLNIVIAANPILFIVAAVAALAAAFYVAYNKIKPFHDAIDAIGRALKTAFVDSLHAVETAVGAVVGFVEKHWKLIAPIILLPITPIVLVVAAVVELGKHWSSVWHGMLQVAGFIVGSIIQDVIKPIVDAFLYMARSIIDTAASAFGWVPGLGGKLKGAKRAVDGFVKDTNSSLQGWANDAFKWGDSAGSSVASGFAAGAARGKANVVVATKGLSGTAVKQLHEGLEIGSPSKVAQRAGVNFGTSFADSVESTFGHVIRAVGGIGAKATDSFGVHALQARSGSSTAIRGHDGSDLLRELQLLRVELTGQRVYFNQLVVETRALPHNIGAVINRAGDLRYAPRELR